MYCIYKITNTLNGHTYIGQHKYVDESNPMKGYKGSGLLLWKAYKKYGFENFETEILYSRIRDKSTINAMEIWSIAKYKPEYNIAIGGQGGAAFKGHKHSEESNRQNSIKHIGKHRSEETRKKTSETMKGRKHSLEHNMKVSKALKGRVPGMLNKHHSEETRKKISEANKGKHLQLKGTTLSEEHKKKISEAMKGKKLSEEARRKISEANKVNKIGKHWYNNGIENVFASECPEGLVKGQIRRS